MLDQLFTKKQLKEHSGHTVEGNTPQLHILLLAQCQTNQVWLETNTVCLLRCSEGLLSNRDVYQELTQMSSPSPTNLPLILLLCCHCRTCCSKTMIRTSSGSMSEAERKTKPRNIPVYQHQVTEIQVQRLSGLPQIDFSPLPTPLVSKSFCFS